MKRLLRRLSRVADSHSPSSSSPSSSLSLLLPGSKLSSSSRARRCRSYYIPHRPDAVVPAGHLPLCVEDPEGSASATPARRFVVPADLLTTPAIAALLRRSAEEYGYEQSGVLRIPCSVEVFQRVLDSLLAGQQQQQGGGGNMLEGQMAEGGWGFWEDEEEQRELGWAMALSRGDRADCCWCC